MSDLIIHPDQTNKQPVVWVCLNPLCCETGKSDFPFQSDYPTCPKCKSSGYPFVQKRILVHLLIPDPMGNIRGQYQRFTLACDKERYHTATMSNGEAATDNPKCVNCPGCIKAAADKVNGPTGTPMDAAALAAN